jgi:hypothetical protein
MSRIADSKFPAKKRLLPPSKTQFAWAIEQRATEKTYFHARQAQWEALSTVPPPIDATTVVTPVAEVTTPAGTGNRGGAATPDAQRPTVQTPASNRRQVRPPVHLVFRTKVVARTPKRK